MEHYATTQQYAPTGAAQKKRSTNLLVNMLLHLMATSFNRRHSLRKYLASDEGWLNFTVGIRTETGSVENAISFKDGKVTVDRCIPDKTDVLVIFASDSALKKLLTAPTTEQVYMLLKSEMRTEGKQTYLLMFLFFVSVLMHNQQIKGLEKERLKFKKSAICECPQHNPELSQRLAERRAYRMKADSIDPGVKFLKDPYLSQYTLEDFPRLQGFLNLHFDTKAQVCIEMPKLMTEWHKRNGFDTKPDGTPWIPELRRGYALTVGG